MGHEIGLHYEPSYSEITGKDPAQCLGVSLAALENCADIKVESISPHEPTRTGSYHIEKNLMHQFGLRHQAYDNKFVKNMKYISDSSCNWREGCMHKFLQLAQHQSLCILTHPFWWYENSPLENY